MSATVFVLDFDVGRSLPCETIPLSHEKPFFLHVLRISALLATRWQDRGAADLASPRLGQLDLPQQPDLRRLSALCGAGEIPDNSVARGHAACFSQRNLSPTVASCWWRTAAEAQRLVMKFTTGHKRLDGCSLQADMFGAEAENPPPARSLTLRPGFVHHRVARSGAVNFTANS
jgi:hypothetical protein